jgi:hypothetical protein
MSPGIAANLFLSTNEDAGGKFGVRKISIIRVPALIARYKAELSSPKSTNGKREENLTDNLAVR